MSRISTPATSEAIPAAARPLLEKVRQQLGTVANVFLVLANSPVALQGYLALEGALRESTIRPEMRERIALAIAEINGCDYCLSAHTYFARKVAKLDDAEITANRNGASNDLKADAAVRFAAILAQGRGEIADADLAAFRAAGYNDAQTIDVAALVALNMLTNFVNKLAQTDIDFPPITTRAATRSRCTSCRQEPPLKSKPTMNASG